MTTPNYSTRSFAVPANGSIELYREAEFLTCLEATGDFKIKIDNGPSFDFEAGLSISFDRAFTRLELIDVTGALLKAVQKRPGDVRALCFKMQV